MSGEVTKRELLASIVIAILLICLGLFIYGKIADKVLSDSAIYNTALKVKDKDTFNYVIDTQQGNIIVQTKMKVKEPVSFPELKGAYAYVKKSREEYTMHTETYTDSKGKVHTRTYWSWDYAGSESKEAKQLVLYGNTYDINKFSLVSTEGLRASDALKAEYKNRLTGYYYYTSGHVRYSYNVVPTTFDASFIAKAGEKGLSSMPQKSKINLQETDIKGLLANVESAGKTKKIVFWIVWGALIIGVVVLYVKAENKYLEG